MVRLYHRNECQQLFGLQQLFPRKGIMASDLKPKSRRKALKVGSRNLSLQELQSTQIWPDGLLIRPIRSIKKQDKVSGTYNRSTGRNWC